MKLVLYECPACGHELKCSPVAKSMDAVCFGPLVWHGYKNRDFGISQEGDIFSPSSSLKRKIDYCKKEPNYHEPIDMLDKGYVDSEL